MLYDDISVISEMPLRAHRRILVLPRSTHVPPYREPFTFEFVVGTFALSAPDISGAASISIIE